MNRIRRAWKRARALAKSDAPIQVALGQMVASALALASAPIVARAIGPEGRGETAAILAALYIWPIVASLGMPLEIRRATAIDGGAAALRRGRDLALLLVLPSLAVGWIMTVTFFSTVDSAAQVAAVVGLAVSPLAVSWMCDNSVLVAGRRFRAVFLIQIAQPLTYVSLVFVGWVLNLVTVAYVVYCNIAATAAVAILAAFLTRVSPFGPRARLGPFVKHSIHYSGSSIAEAATNRLDQILALPVLGAAQAGLYSVAATIGGVALPLGHALAADSFTRIATLDIALVRDQSIRTVRSALAVGLLSGTLVAVLSPVVIPILFGTPFVGAIVPALITSVGAMAAVPAYVASLILAARGRGLEMTMSQLLRLVSAIGLLLILGPLWGAVGAATAAAIGSWILFLILGFRATHSVRFLLVQPRDVAHAINRLFGRNAE